MPRVRFLFLCVAVLAFALIGCARLNHGDPDSFDIEQSSASLAQKRPAEITVATFNVHMQGPRVVVAAIMSDSDLRPADVIMLQEIQWQPNKARSDAAAIARALGLEHVYAPGYGLDGGGSHGIAILSRLPLSNARVIELPRNHTVVNSGRRVALAATVETAGGELRLWNVHLDNRINPSRRAAQLAPVFAAIAREKIERVLIAGDVNTSPFCWVGNLLPIPCGLQTRRLERQARQAGFSTPTTDAGATSKYLGMRLDAIYVRRVAVESVAVARTRVSDHFPLIARLRASAGARGDRVDGLEKHASRDGLL